MKQVLALLRGEPLPGKEAIPYLGRSRRLEEVIDIAARDKIALNVGGTWYYREGWRIRRRSARIGLRQKAWKYRARLVHGSGWVFPNQVGAGGVAVAPRLSFHPANRRHPAHAPAVTGRWEAAGPASPPTGQRPTQTPGQSRRQHRAACSAGGLGHPGHSQVVGSQNRYQPVGRLGNVGLPRQPADYAGCVDASTAFRSRNCATSAPACRPRSGPSCRSRCRPKETRRDEHQFPKLNHRRSLGGPDPRHRRSDRDLDGHFRPARELVADPTPEPPQYIAKRLSPTGCWPK